MPLYSDVKELRLALNTVLWIMTFKFWSFISKKLMNNPITVFKKRI